MQQLKDILFQCNPCVMCKNNVFHCELSDTCTCNAEENWKKLIEHLNLLENDNKSMHQELDVYYDKNSALVIGDYIQRLGDKFYGMMRCDSLLERNYLVVIKDDSSTNGKIKFDGNDFISALQAAVTYVEGEEL